MQRFPEFLDLCRRRWPGNHVLRVATLRSEYEACLMQGHSEELIFAGTLGWLDGNVPQDTSNFYCLAPHNFLRELSFLAYQPKESKLQVVK